MKINGNLRKVLEMLFIILAGFVLFNVAFLMVALTIQGLGVLLQTEQNNPRLALSVFTFILLLLSWLVFKSKATSLVKATYLTMPLMSILVMIGIVTYTLPQWVSFSLEGLLIGVTLGYVRMKRLSWEYTFSILYCTIVGISIISFNIQI